MADEQPSTPPPLYYATPSPRDPENQLFIRMIKRFVFAVGCGLLFGGLAYGNLTTITRDEASTMIGIGAFLIALCAPLRRRPRSLP